MRAAVFFGPHTMRVQEVETPQIASDEVLIRVAACGICGTDVHIFEGDKGAAETIPPCILGHEFSGIVEQVGTNVRDLQVGDKVCVDPNDACGVCKPCLEGLNHYCKSMIGYGTNTNGGFAQFCKVHAKQAYKLAPQVDFAVAAMAEPLACCLHGIDMCDIQPGSVVCVLGGGMIGLLMVQLAKLAGASLVILSEPVEQKRTMGHRLGADITVDPLHDDINSVLAQHEIDRIGCVIECCGLKATIQQALDLVGYKGTVMLFGLTKPDETVEIAPFSLFEKETTVRASYINPYTMGRAVRLLNSGRIDVSSMVVDKISLDELAEVLGSPERRQLGKYIVDPWKE